MNKVRLYSLNVFTIGIFCLNTALVLGQYSPAGGVTGSDAILKTDSRFKEWVSECTVNRGFIQLSDTTVTYTENGITSNHAFFGTQNDVSGEPKGGMNVVSLGDGGTATVTFKNPIKDGDGPDFAVFENALIMPSPPYQYFLELAFVEVSSDGHRFVRFPSISLTQSSTQIGTFGQLDPTLIYNLAGKYTADYGTPFDLHELADSSGIDITNITHVRLVDVVGSIDPKYGTRDSRGNIINDPFPTPFWNSGFDLQAVGVINEVPDATAINTLHSKKLTVYPNPVQPGQSLMISTDYNTTSPVQLQLFSLTGQLLLDTTISLTQTTILPGLKTGTYILTVKNSGTIYRERLIIVQ